jgi:hypothetical protein
MIEICSIFLIDADSQVAPICESSVRDRTLDRGRPCRVGAFRVSQERKPRASPTTRSRCFARCYLFNPSTRRHGLATSRAAHIRSRLSHSAPSSCSSQVTSFR